MPEVLYWRYQFICWVWCRNILIHLYHVLTTVPSTVWELKTLEKKKPQYHYDAQNLFH